jgi:arylsulfatase A-like enzyme
VLNAGVRARSALLALVAAAAAALPSACGAPPSGVVLISLDTLRRDRLNCYGYERRRVSPHIDTLARDSVVFDHAVSASPWTTPSHMTLLTSLAPSSHGVLTPLLTLMADVDKRKVERLPEARVTLAEALASRGFTGAAFTGGVTMHPAIGFAQGFSLYDVSNFKMSAPGMARIESWLAGHRRRPFFLFWHTFEAHSPYFDARFVAEAVPAAEVPGVKTALGELERRFRGEQPIPPELWARVEGLQRHPELSSALYDGGVASADRWVGELMAILRQAGLYDRTTIVLTSDHGEELGDREPGGIFGKHGHSLYEEMVGVPLIVKLPRQRHAGTRVAAPAPAVDVMPTLLDILGIPAAASGDMEGRSLRPLWEGRETGGRYAFSEALAYESELKSVRTDRYKYILEVSQADVERHGRRYLPAEPAWQLFDLVADPGERRNLLPRRGAAAAVHTGAPLPASLVEGLDAELRRYVAHHFGSSESATLPSETVEKLKALGYVR